MDETGGGSAQRNAISIALARVRGAFYNPKPQNLKIPDEPAIHLPRSAAEAYALGWRQGWIAGKLNSD